MAVPRPLGAESPLPPGIDRLRWGERPALDPAARSLVASLCDAVEGEVVTLTRRLGACQAAAREAARALGEGLAALAGHGPAEQERAERDRAAARLVALASLATCTSPSGPAPRRSARRSPNSCAKDAAPSGRCSPRRGASPTTC